MRLLGLDYDRSWGLIFTIGFVDIIPLPHWRLWCEWGYGNHYYDGYWHHFALGPIFYASWGPT